MRIHVEADAKFFTHLNVHGRNFLGSEYSEAALAWILIVSLDNVFLTLPCVACAVGNTALLWQYGYDFSFYFHI